MNDIGYWLDKTSRTFALAIPLLEEPTRRDVSLAYLLFRIADTLEDSVRLTRDERVEALNELADLIARPERMSAQRLAQKWRRLDSVENPSYAELLGKLPDILDAICECTRSACAAILVHARRTVVGMRRFVEATDEVGHFKLHCLDDLREYCYVVAGIVGELLTELFVIHSPQLRHIRADLLTKAPLFGEALQLVNILKDAAADSAQGRVYLPRDTDLACVAFLARQDLFEAEQYIDALCRADAPASVTQFTQLPVVLAHATLDAIQRCGSGAKLSRADVARALHEVKGNAGFIDTRR